MNKRIVYTWTRAHTQPDSTNTREYIDITKTTYVNGKPVFRMVMFDVQVNSFKLGEYNKLLLDFLFTQKLNSYEG